jgi:heterodisulfide reductase subunit D
MDISTGKLLKGVRADLVEMGVISDDLKMFNERVLENETTFTKDTFKRNEYHQDAKNPQVFYYMGCVMAEKKPEAVLATISILKKLGIPFSTLAKERTCCGGPSYTVGFRKTTKMLGKKNVTLFKKADAPLIITDCPACYDTIANTYKELGLKHDFKVMTTTAYFKELIEEGRLTPSKNVNITITYHDPCIAARGFGDITSARFIFSKIPGLQLKEPFLNKKETQCCGMGGVSHVHHPNESEAIGRQRLEQLLKTGAEKIVTACPACEEGFIIADGGKNERVMDISEIIDMSIE